MKEKALVDTVEKAAKGFADLGPAGTIVYTFEAGIAAIIFLLIAVAALQLYFLFMNKIRKRRKDILLEELNLQEQKEENKNKCKEKNGNGYHLRDRLNSLENNDKTLFSKIDRIIESQSKTNEKLIQIETQLGTLLGSKLRN